MGAIGGILTSIFPWLLLAGAAWLALGWHSDLAKAEGKIAAFEAAAEANEKDRERSAALTAALAQTIQATAGKVVTVTEKIYATDKSVVCDKLEPNRIANDFVFDIINSRGGKAKAGSGPAPALPAADTNSTRRNRQRPRAGGRARPHRSGVRKLRRRETGVDRLACRPVIRASLRPP